MNLRLVGSRRRLVAGALTLTLVAIGAWAWNSSPLNIKDRLFPKHLVEVEPGRLYRSGQIAANLIGPTLDELKIDLILDLSHDRGDHYPAQAAEKRAAAERGIERVNVPLRGSGFGSAADYAKAVGTLARAQERGQRVLVHCRAGDRRTGGVIAAYQLLIQGRSADEARRELERFARRSPDESGLVTFLDRTLPEVSAELARQGFATTPAPQLTRIASSNPPEDGR